MPIIDVQFVLPQGEHPPDDLAKTLAHELGRVLRATPGSLWLRLQVLPASRYAENSDPSAEPELPVFVTVLHAHPKQGQELEAEAQAIAKQVSESIGRPHTQVHVEYAAPAAGRVAFGGTLVQ